MKTREIELGDWLRFKRIRLEALLESPLAFGRTYDEESGMDDPQWKNRARRYIEDPDTLFLIGFDNATAMAMAGCFRDKKKKGVSNIYSLWLDPKLRGGDIAKKFLFMLEGWSATNGMPIMEGFVTENNRKARVFYKKSGFVETNERIKLRWDPSVEEILIRKKLDANQSMQTTLE
ncbi:MAG: GNAT family N-acetyltransferase [Proteobacteria bacterium]|nr:GNAT family N-acetyltransferase [Pseudomonadota bacterium]